MTVAIAQGRAIETMRVPFVAAPTLTGLCLLAATVDLVLNRTLVRVWGDSLSHQALLWLDQGGAFFRNLAAVSGLIALSIALWDLTFGNRSVPISARIGITGLSALLLPITAMIVIMPSQWTRIELVLIIAGVAHALMIMVGLVGIHVHASRLLTAGLSLVVVASLLGIAALLTHLLGHMLGWTEANRWRGAIRYSGEVCYLLAPIPLGAALMPSLRSRQGKLAMVFAFGVVIALTALILVMRFQLGAEFETVLYGAMRLDLFVTIPAAYGILLGIGVAMGIVGLVLSGSANKQLGAGLLLVLAAGYAPRSPILLVMTLLGVTLIVRAALARSTPG